MQNQFLEKNQVWCGLVSLLPSKSDKIMWDLPGLDRSTKTVEFLAHLMAHQAKVLAAQPNEFEA
ncbi:hypothetical protein ACRRTK_002112 [Alexandromys fortis]